MKKSSVMFLQVVVAALGIVALMVMMRFPLTEGRAVNLDMISIYTDPFIVFGYLASVPFFVALHQAFTLLGYLGRNKVFSLSSIKALRNIRYCAIIQSILIVMVALYIRIFHAKDDDPAGFIAVSIVATFVSIVIATVAAVFERTLKKYFEISTF
ncbi:MAG: DUF2975 domain-containing protein [Candidatus Vogelbacteria bacterium]|nr:DUF2975 domain-containing protein [Candidatus Vogelbacteria bacterium]